MNRRPRLPVLALLMLMMGLLVPLVSGSAARGADGPEARYLLLRRDPETTVPAMAQEMARQAVLNVARDDLGLLARDEAIGESIPEGAPSIVLTIKGSVQVGFIKDGVKYGTGISRYVIELRRGAGPRVEVFVPVELPDDKDPKLLHDAMENLGTQLDAIGRLAREELPAALRKLVGTTKTAESRAARDAEPVPPQVAAALAEMSPFAQYAALRSLHAAIRDNGASPERLGALVRAYANLGSQTEHAWMPISDVYQARSLLYAGRLVALDPESPRGYWHRAYAWTLAGAHGHALADLDAADRHVAAGVDAPDWVRPLRAACRFDTDALADPAPGVAGLASWLRFLAVEDCGIATRIEAMGDEALRASPEAFRIAGALADGGRIHIRHEWSVKALERLSRSIPARLAPLPGLPPEVARRLAPRFDEVAVTRALADSGASDDSPAPTWAALARIIRELRFAQAESRLDFMRTTWNVPVDDFLAAVRPFVADHPYRHDLEAYAFRKVDPQRRDEALRKLRVDRESADIDAIKLYKDVARLDDSQNLDKGQQWIWPIRRADRTHRDLVLLTANITEAASLANYAGDLLEASPHSPSARVILILNDWPKVVDQAKAWEREATGWPEVQMALGKRYRALGQLDDARRCYEAAIRVVRSGEAYRGLADVHRASGRNDLWKSTLDEYLAGDEPGLDAASLRVEIARHLLAEGRVDEARKYAEEAAESGAEWAMMAAADAAGAAGDWPAAEEYIIAIAERYGRVLGWYFWCLETGHGDVKAARRAVDSWVRDQAAAGQPVIPWIVGPLQILDDRPREALQTLKASFAEGQRLGEGSLLALLADEQGDRPLRDKTWAAITKFVDAPQSVGRLGEFAKLAIAALGKEPIRLDTAAVDALIRGADAPIGADISYYAGRFLELHGRKDEARRYLQQAVSLPTAREPIRALAAVRLRALGDAPEPEAGR